MYKMETLRYENKNYCTFLMVLVLVQTTCSEITYFLFAIVVHIPYNQKFCMFNMLMALIMYPSIIGDVNK
uniref:Uncharacterized protein n=1 Tax=Megaselia scalaris TaxID=36166 RepID=T1H0T8_MEGSC